MKKIAWFALGFGTSVVIQGMFKMMLEVAWELVEEEKDDDDDDDEVPHYEWPAPQRFTYKFMAN